MKHMVSDHIKKIRSSEEHVQRWWIIVATTMVMIVIISLWIWYISATLPQATRDGSEFATQTKTENQSIFSTIIQGIKITTNDMFGTIRSAGTSLKQNIHNALTPEKPKNKQVLEIPEMRFEPNKSDELEIIPLQ